MCFTAIKSEDTDFKVLHSTRCLCDFESNKRLSPQSWSGGKKSTHGKPSAMGLSTMDKLIGELYTGARGTSASSGSGFEGLLGDGSRALVSCSSE